MKRPPRSDAGTPSRSARYLAFEIRCRRLVIALQKRARAFGIRIERYWENPPPINVLALAVSDVLLREFLEKGRKTSDFTFVQIGAHDGRTSDPLRRLVLKYGFRGVLVEPQPVPFRSLVANYAGAQGLAFENAAIAHHDGEMKLYRFRPGSHVPPWADTLASFSRDYLLANFDDVRGEIEEVIVPALTLASLVKKHALDSVDLMQIDTEGFDYEIIKMIDFRSLRPFIINFEQLLLTGELRQECYRTLARQGYRIAENGVDAVAYLEPSDQSIPSTGLQIS